MGIEDSSRYWSVAMALEHLGEVGLNIAVGIVELSRNMTVTVKVDIAELKPKGAKASRSSRTTGGSSGNTPVWFPRMLATGGASKPTRTPGSAS